LHVLPGIMETAVGELLSVWDYKIEKKIVAPQELFDVDEVLVTNSLMGTVPVLSLDGKFLSKPSDLWQKINEEVFG
jgi:para-aminobenzoate synthetase component I